MDAQDSQDYQNSQGLGDITDYQKFEKLPPLTIAEITVASPSKAPLDDETLQLQLDTINVLENRVDISTFSLERQKQIDNYYRFSPVTGDGKAGKIAMMSSTRSGKG